MRVLVESIRSDNSVRVERISSRISFRISTVRSDIVLLA